MTYIQHLIKNWKVAFHALHDFFAHFIHGLIPCIKIRHHQPYQEDKTKILKCKDCKMWKKRVNSEWGYCNRYNMHTPKETVLCNDKDLRKFGIRKFMERN